MKTLALSPSRNILYLWIFMLLLSTYNLLAQSVFVHIVAPQETVYSISHHYGVSEQEIYRLNEGSELGIRVGQQLRIPQQVRVDTIYQIPSKYKNANIHIVEAGETLYRIGLKYGLSVSELIALNPSLGAEKLHPGTPIVINPQGQHYAEGQDPLDGTRSRGSIHVSLLLPINQGGQPRRYVQFYEGILLGIEEMQRQGLNIALRVESATNPNRVRQLISRGFTDECDLIIGGEDEQSVNVLVDEARRTGAIYVSPFIWQSGRGETYPRFFQMNATPDVLKKQLGRAFTEHFSDYQIIIVQCSTNDQLERIKTIEESCLYESIQTERRSLQELSIGRWPRNIGKKILLVPTSSKREDLEQILNMVQSSTSPSSMIRLFGHPQWQTYGREIEQRLHQVGAIIYSTFYLDEEANEVKQYLSSYQSWFGNADEVGYPRYSVLGYDVIRYFIPAISSYGLDFSDYLAQIPSDGLQVGTLFSPFSPTHASGYINNNLYFITYQTSGNTYRKSVGRR